MSEMPEFDEWQEYVRRAIANLEYAELHGEDSVNSALCVEIAKGYMMVAEMIKGSDA